MRKWKTRTVASINQDKFEGMLTNIALYLSPGEAETLSTNRAYAANLTCGKLMKLTARTS